MALKEIKVRVEDLEIGMFVSRLDRPWIETPYLIQGFLLKTREDIDALEKYCEFVYVDVLLSEEPKKQGPNYNGAARTNDEIKQQLIGSVPKKYKDKTNMNDELLSARDTHRVLSHTVGDVMNDIANNKTLDGTALKRAINPMLDSIISNPDAFVWLTRMKYKDNYTYNHAVSASVWAVSFGRHLGFPRPKLQSLALGAMLFDIGKMKLPEKLINNPKRYNQFEYELVKKHTDYSLEILNNTKGIGADVIEMVATHHERHNGSGYPNGMVGDQIPILGKIAGIVDCYDAIISDRVFATALSPHDAVKKLYDWRDIDFQAELVEQFIQVVGIYPVGTVIELSDGRVGVIVAQHRVWRLRPQVMMLLDTDKKPLENFNVIDLFTHVEDADGKPLNIIKCVEPGLYGIDPEEFYL